MTSPSVFYDAAVLALECICTQMDAVAADLETYPGCPCRAYVSTGPTTFDNCCEDCGDDQSNHGQLTVQVTDVFQSINFPSSAAFIHPCAPASWVAQMIATVVRCDPSQDEQGNPPSIEALSASAELAAIDLRAVLLGLTCCLPGESIPGKTKRRVQLTNAGNTEVPGEGGCVGIEVRFYVEIGPVCGCPPEVS